MKYEMMIPPNAPNHVIDYCYRDEQDKVFSYLREQYEAENSFVHKLRCACKCNEFVVFKDAHPSVFAECCNCGRMITVYDLKYYPAAVKIQKDFVLNRVEENAVSVYANYEYDDEFLHEEDVEFNADDITWGKVFIASNNELRKILDDETA